MGDKREKEMRPAILDVMGQPDYWPRTVRDLVHLLKVPREDRNAFKRTLRSLISDREVVKVRPNRYMAAERARRGERFKESGGDRGRTSRTGGARAVRGDPVVTGRLQRNRRGFGFVTPDSGGHDIFIPPPGLGDYLNGDRVQVRVVRRGREGRTQGEVVRVVERSTRRVMGVFRASGGKRGGSGEVDAYDRQFNTAILIPAGSADGAREGLVVGVEITRGPSGGAPATGRVVEVLGPPDEPGVDLQTVIRKYDLSTEFPPEVMQEAARVPEQIDAEIITGREDFRSLPIVTIDGETAKDFDDAVFVRRLPRNRFELQVHIADVSHYVRPSSALDREAHTRGTSVYFPGTAIPMLPHALSNGVCSLNPGVDRLVQSCLMTFDAHGHLVEHRFAEGVIRSAARMTYTEVAKILVDRDAKTIARHRDLVPIFRLMEELSEILNGVRVRRGSIDFDLPEPEIILAATGEMTGILALERNVAHRLIEEFMLAANETVARYLWQARAPSMYRVHEKPDPKKLEEFDLIAQAFGYRLPRPFTAIRPAALQALVEESKGKPEERFLSRLMLRSMKQARYSERRDIHFGLASSCYTHFTSPIRRYPDLVVHRVLRRFLTGRPLLDRERRSLEDFLPEAALHSSRTERNADAAENELIERKKLAFMAERVGEEFEGFILSVHPFGLFVELREYFIDGLVPIETLRDDYYDFLERKQMLKGERHGRVFRIGDAIRVRVDRVNHFMLQVDFSPVGLPVSKPEPRRKGRLRPRTRRRDMRQGRR